VRYKQTISGSAWAIIQPFDNDDNLYLIFGDFAKIPSDGLPYSIFAYRITTLWRGLVSLRMGCADFASFSPPRSVAALAVGLCLSALNTRYRGVGHTVPFLIQVGCTPYPVAYPVSLIPEQWRLLYTLNPMAGVIEGFRWTLLGKEASAFGVMAVSAIVVLALLLTRTVFFRRMERTFADVIAEFDYFRHFGNISPCLG
jgi:lipopolysaccharide transport system permease protein